MKEQWAIINFYDNYAVSSFGKVLNLHTGRLLEHQSSKRGGHYAEVESKRISMFISL